MRNGTPWNTQTANTQTNHQIDFTKIISYQSMRKHLYKNVRPRSQIRIFAIVFSIILNAKFWSDCVDAHAGLILCFFSYVQQHRFSKTFNSMKRAETWYKNIPFTV